MKILRTLFSVIWRASIAVVIATSGIYLFSKILEILVNQGVSDIARQVFGFMYCLVVVGVIYKFTLHDDIMVWWEKRKMKEDESSEAKAKFKG